MTLAILLSLIATLALGYGLALILTRSRVELARAEAASNSAVELAEARARIALLEQACGAGVEASQKAEEGMTVLRGQLEQARLESARVGAQVEAERAHVADLEARSNALEVAQAHGARNVESLQTERASLQATLAESRATLDYLTQERETLAANAEGQSGELQALRREHLAASSLAATLTAQVAAETLRIAEFQAEAAQQDSHIQEVALALETVQNERATLQACLAESRANLAHLIQERETLSEEVARKTAALEEAQAELQAKAESIVLLTEQLAGVQQIAEARLEAFQVAQTQMSETFQGLSAEALRTNSETFLQLAGTQMQGAQAASAADLEARRVAIENLVAPVQTTMNTMQEQVQRLATDRVAAEASLGTHIQNLVSAQQGLQSETSRLAGALSKPEVRGQWGEIQLRNVVEYAGMKEHVDFVTQDEMELDGKKRYPDMVVKMPGGKLLAVDSKTTARAYLESLELKGEARAKRLKDVAAQVRNQVEALGRKGYYNGLVESPDFVVLFLPLEVLFSVALEQDPNLLEFAAQHNVIPASPTTLLALLKAAAYGWDQARVQANAEEIQKLGAELLKRLSDMAGHTQDLRNALEGSVKAFNAFAGNLESRVMVSGQRMLELGIKPVITGQGKKGKKGTLRHHAPPAISMDLNGLPKLGIAGPKPPTDVEILEGEEEDEVEAEVEVEVGIQTREK